MNESADYVMYWWDHAATVLRVTVNFFATLRFCDHKFYYDKFSIDE